MNVCHEIQALLPQYVADDMPSTPEYAPVVLHLDHCLDCRAYLQQLVEVERALRSYPRTPVPPILTRRILHAVRREARPRLEKWQLLPWDIWVPALAFALALSVFIIMAPARFYGESSIAYIEPSVGHWPDALTALASSLVSNLSEDDFWLIWVGVFTLLAGLGLRLSLTSWNTYNSASVNRLERQVSDVANRLWNDMRRAH